MTERSEAPALRTRNSETVLKALGLLDRFLLEKRPMSLSELAAATGIHKTTVFRLCNSLVTAGLLQRTAKAQFFLGPKVWRLAQVYRQGSDVESLIRPTLAGLRNATSESASFYVRDGDWRICAFRENAVHAVRHHVEEGARLPLRKGVVGHVILAACGEPGADYERIRADGHLIAQGREPYTASVAVPVFAANEDVLGALVVSGPSARFGQRERLRALELARAAAAHLSERIADARLLSPATDAIRPASGRI